VGSAVAEAVTEGGERHPLRMRSCCANSLVVPRPHTGRMVSRISHTSFDARNAYEQSVFWSKVLDWIEDPDDPNLPEHDECPIMSRDRTEVLLFINVPDDKIVKNRVHLDLRPVEGTREDEVARLVALGATKLADFRRPDGSGWITLADPEGNEFCVLSREPASTGPTA
jgi:predicted enzyme related to lactoylglutathione lyase